MSDLPAPLLTWRDDGSPVSDRFGDIYFSIEGGLAEAQYVFLQGNHLPNAWAGRTHFTIGETGFGTGLNFLATLALWESHAAPDQHLHFVSVEGFPLSPADMARALSRWSMLAPQADALLAVYPPLMRGTHQLSISDTVTLTLIADEALPALQGLTASVDAWFLDGFSPSTNPAMWSPEIFSELARLSCPGATLATFTAAGAVRRGLGEAGFAVEKVPGFGRKRHMLNGTFEGPTRPSQTRPWYQIPAPRKHEGPVAIIGAGIAGASVAYALHRAGLTPHLFDGTGLGAGASGNPAGLFMPRLAADGSADGRFHVAAYLHGERFLSALNDRSIFKQSGVMQFARRDEEAERFEAIVASAALPDAHMLLLTAEQVREKTKIEAKYPALYFPKAGTVSPLPLLKHLTKDTALHSASIHSLAREEDGWALLDADGRSLGHYGSVVLANGTALSGFPQTGWLPLEAIRGQISLLPPDVLPPLSMAFSAGSYTITLDDGATLIGATYERGHDARIGQPATADAHRKNLAALSDVFQNYGPLLDHVSADTLEGRTSFRAQVPDRVPFAGPAPDHDAYLTAYDRLRHGDRFAAYPPAPVHSGLFLLGGLGARGFSTSLILGELIAAEMVGAPLPFAQDLLETLHPARFIIRGLRKSV